MKRQSEEQSRQENTFLLRLSNLASLNRVRKSANSLRRSSRLEIDPSKIGDVVGQKGKVINQIIDETGVKIDITDDGAVSICGVDKVGIQKAIDMITMIVSDFEEGRIYTGKVVSIKEFGAFLEFAPGKEGMVHISKA